jgi:hypothetical protein
MRAMLVSVAGQFGFDEPSLWGMPVYRLVWWYRAVEELHENAK